MSILIEARTLGELIQVIRWKARWSQPELAAAAGVSNGTISQYETDKARPKLAEAWRVCKALADKAGVDVLALWHDFGTLSALDGQENGDASKGYWPEPPDLRTTFGPPGDLGDMVDLSAQREVS